MAEFTKSFTNNKKQHISLKILLKVNNKGFRRDTENLTSTSSKTCY